MNIEAISGSATVAIACTFVFLLAAKSWHLVARSMSAHPNFPDAIMREAAQRFRDQLETLSRKQSTYLGAGLRRFLQPPGSPCIVSSARFASGARSGFCVTRISPSATPCSVSPQVTAVSFTMS
jgi:hypothetical protein